MKTDKEINDFLNSIFNIIGISVIKIIQFFLKGIYKLTTIKRIACFLVSVIFSYIMYCSKDIFYELVKKFSLPESLQIAIYILLLGIPVLFLLVLGGIDEYKQKKYERIFEDIGFKDKRGKYPYFITSYKQKEILIYIFKSNISCKEWKTNEDRLEAGFDCNILRISNEKSKKIIKLETVPSDFQIPIKIDWNDCYRNEKESIITIGEWALGQISFDLDKTAHVLVAGETGSGKSVILRNTLWQMICTGSIVYMIDFKGGVEFGKDYECYGEVITDMNRVLYILTELVAENKKRLEVFRELRVKNIEMYRRKTGKKLCRIGVFCDEIAEMLDKKGVNKKDREIYEKIEAAISSLARLSRATGINLIIGAQRPDANILPGQIKNNIPIRISGRFADKAASEIVLGNTAATELPEIQGRFIFRCGNELREFQAYYFDDDTMLHDVDVESGKMLIEDVQNRRDSNTYKNVKNLSQKQKKLEQEEKQMEIKKEDYTDSDIELDFDFSWSNERKLNDI